MFIDTPQMSRGLGLTQSLLFDLDTTSVWRSEHGKKLLTTSRLIQACSAQGPLIRNIGPLFGSGHALRAIHVCHESHTLRETQCVMSLRNPAKHGPHGICAARLRIAVPPGSYQDQARIRYQESPGPMKIDRQSWFYYTST